MSINILSLCSEDDEEYTAETFPWKRQTRDLSPDDSFSQKTLIKGRKSMKFGMIDDSFSDCQTSPKCHTKDLQGLAYKVIQWLHYLQCSLFKFFQLLT